MHVSTGDIAHQVYFVYVMSQQGISPIKCTLYMLCLNRGYRPSSVLCICYVSTGGIAHQVYFVYVMSQQGISPIKCTLYMLCLNKGYRPSSVLCICYVSTGDIAHQVYFVYVMSQQGISPIPYGLSVIDVLSVCKDLCKTGANGDLTYSSCSLQQNCLALLLLLYKCIAVHSNK